MVSGCPASPQPPGTAKPRPICQTQLSKRIKPGTQPSCCQGPELESRVSSPHSPPFWVPFPCLCLWVCWLFKWEEERYSLPWFLISPKLKGWLILMWSLERKNSKSEDSHREVSNQWTSPNLTSTLSLQASRHHFHSIPARILGQVNGSQLDWCCLQGTSGPLWRHFCLLQLERGFA